MVLDWFFDLFATKYVTIEGRVVAVEDRDRRGRASDIFIEMKDGKMHNIRIPDMAQKTANSLLLNKLVRVEVTDDNYHLAWTKQVTVLDGEEAK